MYKIFFTWNLLCVCIDYIDYIKSYLSSQFLLKSWLKLNSHILPSSFVYSHCSCCSFLYSRQHLWWSLFLSPSLSLSSTFSSWSLTTWFSEIAVSFLKALLTLEESALTSVFSASLTITKTNKIWFYLLQIE